MDKECIHDEFTSFDQVAPKELKSLGREFIYKQDAPLELNMILRFQGQKRLFLEKKG